MSFSSINNIAVTTGIQDKGLFLKRPITARVSTLEFIYLKQSSVVLQNAAASSYCLTEIILFRWILMEFTFFTHALQEIFLKVSEVTVSQK